MIVKLHPMTIIDIPKLAFLEHEIFVEVHGLGGFTTASENILEAKGLQRDAVPPPPYLQTRILSLLYLLFVFPHDLWQRTEIGKETIRNLQRSNSLSTFSGKSLKDFLRHVRNAISHARVVVLPDGTTTFVDQNRGGKENFRQTLSLAEVRDLLSAVGVAFGELREGPSRTAYLHQLGANP